MGCAGTDVGGGDECAGRTGGALWRVPDVKDRLAKPRAAFKAAFVVLFMAFMALHAATGFMRDLFAGGNYPRAMRAFGWILDTLFVGPLGKVGGTTMLVALGLLFAMLAYRRTAREDLE